MTFPLYFLDTGFQQLKADVESMRKEAYSAENPDHEEKLMRLWTALMPGVHLQVCYISYIVVLHLVQNLQTATQINYPTSYPLVNVISSQSLHCFGMSSDDLSVTALYLNMKWQMEMIMTFYYRIECPVNGLTSASREKTQRLTFVAWVYLDWRICCKC